MRFLPLYENGGLLAPIDQEARLSLNSTCTRCDLSKGTKTVCMPAEGHVGLGEQAPLLLVGESPGAHEDRAGRPFVGPSGSYLRGLIAKYWPDKPYVLDNALRCAQPSRTGKAKKGSKLGQERIEACRGYLAGTLDESMPARVLALGSTAVESILGRSPAIMSVIGGYGWCGGAPGGPGIASAIWPHVPVYLLPNPAAVIANKWLRKEFEEHFREAVLGPLPVPTFGGQARVVEDGFDAAMAHADLDGAEWVVVDVESAGMLHEPEWFELLSVALTRNGGEHAYVWGTESLADPNARGALASILAKAKLAGQNGKYDLLVLRQEGFPVGHLEGGDVMLARRLLDAGKMARLEYTAELVGLGGHKEEAQEALQAAAALPSKILRARARRRDVKRSKAKEAELEALAAVTVHPIVERALAEKWEAERYGFMLLTPDVLHVYNARDAVTTARLAEREMPRLLATPGIGDTWREIVSGATHAYMRIEEWGIAADRDALERFAYFVDVKQVEVLRRLQSYELNLRSPEQVAELLFEKLGLPTQHKTDGGAWSTDEKALEKLKGHHPVVDDLLEWRRLDKLRSQYADGGPRTEPDAPFQLGHKGLVPHIHSDGRIHPNYKIAGTECLPAGELVLTDRGYVSIERVVVGNQVLSHLGRPQRVSATSVHAPSPIVQVTLSNGLRLKTTRNHPYLTASGEWVNAIQLNVGVELVVHSDAERWACVEASPSYDVSSWGRVRNRKNGRLVSPSKKGTWGHLKVSLQGPRKDFSVHRLVLRAFGELGHGLEVRHKSGIAWDNTIGNLEAGTSKENRGDAVMHGTMSHRVGHGQVKLSQSVVDEIRLIPRCKADPLRKSDRELAERFGVSRELVRDVRSGKRWQPKQHKGKKATFYTARVCHVEFLPDESTYGLTVDGDQSHVTGGIVTHNTGRGAASDPNLYNQPRAETEEGKMVRDIYVAPPGTVLIEFDQSQVELRVAADLSGDKVMKQTFVDGVDIYLRAAQLIAWVWRMKPEDITKESIQRQETKTTVLSLAYQKGTKTLAADLGIPVEKAEKIVQSILGEFTDFRRWIEERKREVRRTGEVWTRWRGKNARRRKLYDIGWSGDDDAYRVAEAERAAVNSPIQGTANDYTMASVIEVVKWIEEESVPAKLVLSVYDSIMLEVEERAVEEVLWVVPRIMTSWPTETGVPLVADAKMGRSWGSLEKVKLR